MKKNILVFLIFFGSLLKVGHFFYNWIKKNPQTNEQKNILSNDIYVYNEFNLLNGFWAHEKDSLATVEIKYKIWKFLYNGELEKNDIYQYQITDTLSNHANVELRKGRFLTLTNKKDTLEYEILTYNDSIMALLYFPKGNIHIYKKSNIQKQEK